MAESFWFPSRFETVSSITTPLFISAATIVAEGVSPFTRQLLMPPGFAFMFGVDLEKPIRRSPEIHKFIEVLQQSVKLSEVI